MATAVLAASTEITNEPVRSKKRGHPPISRMAYSTAYDSRNSKRARLNPPPGDVDRISGLDDDVLLHILALLPDARDAVRTCALSRRWLGLWTRVPALRFAGRSVSTADLRPRVPGLPVLHLASESMSTAGLERFVSSVNGVLARRSQSGCAIESLAISYDADYKKHSLENRWPARVLAPWQRVIPPPCPIYTDSAGKLMLESVDAVQGWIRYAFQHRVKSLDIDLSLPSTHRRRKHWRDRDHDGEEKPVVFLGDLPTSPDVRLEAMRLALGGAGLRLSTTVKFASLTVLSLERMDIPAGGVRLLVRLVSSASCPRLQKLSMRKIGLDAVDDEMRLEAQVLSELVIDHVAPLTSLKLRTPSLRVLHIDTCSYELLSIKAPRLEQVAIFFEPQELRPYRWLHVDGDLPCVRRVKLCLWSHRDRASRFGEAENNCGILLLRQCSFLTCLDVTLEGQKECEMDVDMIKRRVPHFLRVTSLTINVSVSFVNKRHGFGASVASLLTRFNNLRRLRLNLPFFFNLRRNDFLCDHPNHWINEFSMGHLEEAEFTGFTGIDCELWFIKAMLASAKRLHKVDMSFNPNYRLPQGRMDAFERLLLGGGMWTSHRDTYALTCIRYN